MGVMPKEIITNGAFRRGNPWLQVGWSRGTYVQVGVLTEGGSQALPETPGDDLNDPEKFCPVCFAGEESPEHREKCVLPAELAPEGEALFCDLDRDGINKMIRALRKARDQAYGSDA